MRPEDVSIRNDLQPGDLGHVMYRHGVLYSREYGYGIEFEAYVGEGLIEFWRKYDPRADRVWICEHEGQPVGFLSAMHRGEGTAQLRYFYLEPEYRGIGLGKRMMRSYMDFLTLRGYRKSYLWTTHELVAAASLYARYGFRLTVEKESGTFGKKLLEQRYDWLSGH